MVQTILKACGDGSYPTTRYSRHTPNPQVGEATLKLMDFPKLRKGFKSIGKIL